MQEISKVNKGEQNRVDYIDFAKALGMLTIMWGHIATGASVRFVYAFHIPLFFFLSGMVFRPDKYTSFGPFVKRKVQTLIVPYIIYSIITWGIWAAFSYLTHSSVDSYWSPLFETLIARGSEGYLVHNVPLWFVSCLFVVELSYYWISKLKDGWVLLISVLLAPLGYILVNYVKFFDFTTLPWSIEVAMLAMIFYCLGHQIVKHFGYSKVQDIVGGKKLLSFVLMLIAFCLVYIGSQLNGQPSMGHANIHNPALFYPTALAGVLGMLIMSCLFSLSKLNLKGRFNGLKWFGQNSFIAMAIHNPIKGFIIIALAYLFHTGKMDIMRSTPTALLAWLICIFTTVICMIIIVKFKKRIKLKKHNK